MDRDEVVTMLWSFIARWDSQKTAAKKLKVSPSYLNDVLQGRREPGPKLLAALKIRRVEGYEHL